MSSAKIKILVILFVFGFFTVSVKSETSAVPSEVKSSHSYYPNPHRQAQYVGSYTSSGQQHNPASSRDSYADAATDLGYGAPSGTPHVHTHSHMSDGQPMMYHYQVNPMGDSHSSVSSYGPTGNDEHDDEMGGKGGGVGGEIGLLGLLGLKGLKGVKFFKAAKALAVLGPIVGPILGPILMPILGIAAPLLLLPVLLLLLPMILQAVGPLLLLGLAAAAVATVFLIPFIPIPVITIPGRSATASLVQAARGALESTMNEDCVERITCQISRAAKLYGYDPPWVTDVLEKSSSKYKWMDRVSRAYKSSECQNYKCGIANTFEKILKIN